MSDNKNLASKTFKGVLWNYAIFAGAKLVNFIVTVILARVLIPQDFGLAALGLVAINFLEIVNRFGIGSAVIQRQDDDERITHVAFWINVFIGILLTILSFLSAPLIADFMREPRLVEILRVLSLTFVASTIYAIPEALLNKQLKFRQRLIPELSKTITKGSISITLALMGFGVWSLVWGHIGGMLIAGLIYWFMATWRPRFVFDIRLAGGIMRYGGQLVIGEFLGVVNRNADYLIVGRGLSVTQVGYYNLAFRLPELLIISLVGVVGHTVFPVYAQIQHNNDALRKGFFTLLRHITLLTLPMGIGLFMIAPEFIHIVYTSRWQPAIPVMQALSLYAVILSLSYNTGDIYKAIGRPGILTQLGILKIVITIPLLLYAVQFNILAVALAQLASMMILTVIRLGIIKHILHVKIVEILEALRPTLISTMVMFIGTMFIRQQLLVDLSMLSRMILTILAAMPLYLVTLWFVGEGILQEALSFLTPMTAKFLPFRSKPS